MVAGHWVPEMVEKAGGKMLLSRKGERSQEVSWNNILIADPEILVIAPCGFSIKRTLREMSLITEREGFTNLKAYKNNKIFLVDGDTYLTRPGPRIVDGVEILAEILFPKIFLRTYSQNAWIYL